MRPEDLKQATITQQQRLLLGDSARGLENPVANIQEQRWQSDAGDTNQGAIKVQGKLKGK